MVEHWQLKTIVAHLAAAEAAWQDLLSWSSHALPPEQRHVVTYDALVSNTASATDTLFRFLGVASMNATSTYVKDAKCAAEMARDKVTLDPSKILKLLNGAKQSWDQVRWRRPTPQIRHRRDR